MHHLFIGDTLIGQVFGQTYSLESTGCPFNLFGDRKPEDERVVVIKYHKSSNFEQYWKVFLLGFGENNFKICFQGADVFNLWVESGVEAV